MGCRSGPESAGRADTPRVDVTPNFFTSPQVKRLSNRRQDRAWVTAQLEDAGTSVLPVWRGQNLFAKGSDAQKDTH